MCSGGFVVVWCVLVVPFCGGRAEHVVIVIVEVLVTGAVLWGSRCPEYTTLDGWGNGDRTTYWLISSTVRSFAIRPAISREVYKMMQNKPVEKRAGQ